MIEHSELLAATTHSVNSVTVHSRRRSVARMVHQRQSNQGHCSRSCSPAGPQAVSMSCVQDTWHPRRTPVAASPGGRSHADAPQRRLPLKAAQFRLWRLDCSDLKEAMSFDVERPLMFRALAMQVHHGLAVETADTLKVEVQKGVS